MLAGIRHPLCIVYGNHQCGLSIVGAAHCAAATATAAAAAAAAAATAAANHTTYAQQEYSLGLSNPPTGPVPNVRPEARNLDWGP